MRQRITPAFAALALVPTVAFPQEPLQGFTRESSAVERRWEEKFRAIPGTENLRESMRRLSARPHHVGSPYDRDNAEWIRARFAEYGWDARIETFEVLFPTPRERVVEMVEPMRFVAALEEPPVAGDPTSGQKDEQLPTYNAYSRDGEATAPLVFVNYGLPKDYDELDRRGVSAKGAIVIAKYGNSWRGIKPKVAAEHGAVGCLIYSDPADDGYAWDDVYPEGPMRPPSGVQRGSVMDFPSSSPGDPLTPGVGATHDAKRLAISQAPSITKIPVLPISYGDARALLAAMKGPVAPQAWRGALPIVYRLGPGPAKVHLKLSFHWDIKPIYDVVARIPGASLPDQWVVRGNHHDAWVNGAYDPTSGQVAMLEEARALGQLLREGWKPRRTIVYCAWDGEEPMLLGSTEWVETHARELTESAIAYINTDATGRGFLSMEGSHTLERLVNDVARQIADPETRMSVGQRRRLHGLADAKTAVDRKELRDRPDVPLDPLGSGTDYTAFVDHLGIASLNLGFGDEDHDGIYHSIYDDFSWYTRFADTDFRYGQALSRIAGTAVLRLADAELLPFDFTALSDAVNRYLKEVRKLAADQRDEIAERNRRLDEGVFAADDDPRRPTRAPAREQVPPHVSFAPLENASEALGLAAKRYEAAVEKASAVPATVLESVNRKLRDSERRLTSPEGLLRRPWYKHMLYAPGVYAGYAAKTMPGVREAIEQKRFAEADAEAVRLAKVLDGETALVNSAAEELERAAR